MALAEVPGESIPERRRDARHRVLKYALIVFNAGYSTMYCRIVDVSDTGAKLMPADLFTCPGEFVLKPESENPATVKCNGGRARR